jgi:putative membrane protein
MFGTIDIGTLAILSFVMLITGLISYKIHIFTGELFAEWAGRIDFRKVSAGAFVFVIALVFATSGLFGLLIATVASAIGLVPALAGVSRTHCMGCLLLPTLLFFLGI